MDAAGLGLVAEGLAEHVADVHDADRGAGHAGNLELRHAVAGVAQLDLDLLVVELALAQALAEGFARRRAGGRADQRGQHALLGGQLRLGRNLLPAALAHQPDADLDEIADDLLDVAADIADLGELGRLDLDEGGAGEPGQAARDLGLADAGRADHQDVLGQHLLAHVAGELLAAPAVAQRDGDGALGVVLADDVAVEFGDDLPGRECSHRVRPPNSSDSSVTLVLV